MYALRVGACKASGPWRWRNLSYSQNSIKGGVTGDFIGEGSITRVINEDTRSLDHSSFEVVLSVLRPI